jgi:hypothetical protein
MENDYDTTSTSKTLNERLSEKNKKLSEKNQTLQKEISALKLEIQQLKMQPNASIQLQQTDPCYMNYTCAQKQNKALIKEKLNLQIKKKPEHNYETKQQNANLSDDLVYESSSDLRSNIQDERHHYFTLESNDKTNELQKDEENVYEEI